MTMRKNNEFVIPPRYPSFFFCCEIFFAIQVEYLNLLPYLLKVTAKHDTPIRRLNRSIQSLITTTIPHIDYKCCEHKFLFVLMFGKGEVTLSLVLIIFPSPPTP